MYLYLYVYIYIEEVPVCVCLAHVNPRCGARCKHQHWNNTSHKTTSDINGKKVKKENETWKEKQEE